MKNKNFNFKIILLSLLSLNAFNASASNFQKSLAKMERTEPSRMQFQFAPEAASLIKSPVNSISTGAGIALIYGMSEKFGIGSGIRHAVYSPNESRSNVFTQFDVRFIYSVNGGMYVPADVMEYGSYKKMSGLKFSAYLGQYYFASEVTPYSGFGVGASYEFPINKHFHYLVGTRVDEISIGNQLVIPIQMHAGVGVRL